MSKQTKEKNKKVSVSIHESFYYNQHLNLPTIIKEYDQIEEIFENLQYLACISVHINQLNKIEQLYGSLNYNTTLSQITNIIKDLKKELLRNDDIFVVDIYDADTFIIFLSPPRNDNTLLLDHLEGITERIRIRLEEQVFTLLYPYLKEFARPSIGYALEIKNPMVSNMRMVTQLINSAMKMGSFLSAKRDNMSKFNLQKIIIEQQITTVFQPIVNLQTLDILGYEALSRGPAETEFYNPLLLFMLASETGLSFELDRLCRKKSLERSRHITTEKKIFVNTLSMTIHDPEFRGTYLKELLADLELKPENVIFEVSEKLAIDNYDLFRNSMQDYTDLGIVHAGDDMGTGHSGLERIMELNPGFLKVDISFAREIDKNYVKQEIVKAIVTLAKKITSQVIVEGIETKEEYETLRDLGVCYGQGYLFAKPSEMLGDINRDFLKTA